MSALLTYLGHASFSLETPQGSKFYLDAWLRENPFCPEGLKTVDRATAFLVTHGHGDHLDGDLVSIAGRLGAPVVASGAIRSYLEQAGFNCFEFVNFGGTVRVADVDITMTLAFHDSNVSAAGKGAFPHAPCGFVLRGEAIPTIYFAGDTAIFKDMELIGELYQPSVALLPIGGRATMGPYEAAKAAQMLGVTTVVPKHYGTFPFLPGKLEDFEACLPSTIKVRAMAAGETIELI
jgi:L-ascorbate metabolism protein UlaG (beta-lactamase superfamily)